MLIWIETELDFKVCIHASQDRKVSRGLYAKVIFVNLLCDGNCIKKYTFSEKKFNSRRNHRSVRGLI